LDRNGKKPKATHNHPPHPERSDTKASHRDAVEGSDAKDRADAERAEVNERLARKHSGQKGPQRL
jgi:hypothetical protein